MSMCGGLDQPSGPTDEEFERNIIQYSEVRDSNIKKQSVKHTKPYRQIVFFLTNSIRNLLKK